MVFWRLFGRSPIAATLVLGLASAFLTGRPLLAQDEEKEAPPPQNGAAQPAVASNVIKLLQDGLTHFREGKYAEAVKDFEKAFALDPAQDQILNLINDANAIIVMQMLRSEDPQISGIAKTILELRRKKVRTRTANPEEIKAVVDKVFSSKDPQEQMVTMLEGANKYGRNLVPFLINKLGDSETSVRTLALLWVPKIETDAIPPLVAAAHHPNAMVRQNVASLLGVKSVRHFFSLGTLAGMMETDPENGVKEAARESLGNILRDIRESEVKEIFPAKVYHANAANLLYLYPHRNPFAGPEYAPTVYTLKDKDVVGEVVAPFQLSTRMAETELVEALKLDPGYLRAKVALLANEALQVVEYDSALGFYTDKEPEVKGVLDSQKDIMDWVRRNRIKAYQPEVLYAALKGALKDRRPEVAEKLLEVIRANRIRGPIPQAMVEALTDESSKLVRIAAAVTIAYWNPEETDVFGEAVVGILAEASVNSGIRTVHKVMGNGLNANRFDAVFRELNLESGSNFPNIAMALERAVALPPDLILVDEEVAPVAGAREHVPVNAFVTELRKTYRTKTTPVVVAADPAKLAERKADYEKEGRMVIVIAADADKTTFKNQVIDKLFAASEDAKARATRLAARAAEALAHLTSTNTRFPVATARGALLKVLQNRPDEVRVPALTALGNLREAAAPALRPIAEVYSNKENDPKVREAAMLALGRILSAGEEPAQPEVLRAIVSGLPESDPKLREASYIAFSVARAADADQVRLLIDEAKAPAAAAPAAGGKAEKPAEGEAKEGEEKPAAGETKPEAKEGEAEKAEKPEETGGPEK